MPILELLIEETSGALVTVYIKHSREAMPPLEVKALLDTGASRTSLDPSVVTELGLIDAGETEVQDFTSPEGTVLPRALCNLVIPGSGIEMEIFNLPVIQAPLEAQGFKAILGRDILSKCVVVWDGRARRCTLAY